MPRVFRVFYAVCLCSGADLFATPARCAETWPALPERNAMVTLPAQEWPLQPGPRTIAAWIYYPGGGLQDVGRHTGLMLSLHNWGGNHAVGTADPRTLAERFHVVVICVDYLQSGRKASIEDPEPYDFGYLQALDALRALWLVFDGLKASNHPFDTGRIYATGGSGGGNVALMCNKLAPRTFACAINLSGMAKLNDDVAFNLPGGSDLAARYSRDPANPYCLSTDAQELRYVGHPDHLAVMRRLNSVSKVIVVHGAEDRSCPLADVQEMVHNLRVAKLDVEPHLIGPKDVDGKVFKNPQHSLGGRTQIVLHVASRYLDPESPQMLQRAGATDFERRDALVRYPTSSGAYVISYESGYPLGRFEAEAPPPAYSDHQRLLVYRDVAGAEQAVASEADWKIRRRHIAGHLQSVMGRLPVALDRVPLDVQQVEEVKFAGIVRRKITYQSDREDRVAAYLFLPELAAVHKTPAVLCLHQTARLGKSEAAGLSGDPSMHYALHLAQRGYVTIAPDYPSFGEHVYDFAAHPRYLSGTMKAIWDNIRAIDLLQSLDAVDRERIGCLGHSLGGHNAMFTAVFEPRLKAVVSSCGFTRFGKDDMPSWTGPVYMPRIKTHYQNDAARVPFDFTEIVAAFAPQAFLACAAQRDSDFDVSGVRDIITVAGDVYKLLGCPDNLAAYYPQTGHSFPADARERAYEFLDRHLKPAKK